MILKIVIKCKSPVIYCYKYSKLDFKMDVKQQKFDIIKFLSEKKKRTNISMCEKTMLSYYVCIKKNYGICENILNNNKQYTEKCVVSSDR